MSAYCLFDELFLFLVGVLVFSSLFPLHSPCKAPVQALVLHEPSLRVTKWCHCWLAAGPETLELNCSSHCFLQMSASQDCGNWWPNSVVWIVYVWFRTEQSAFLSCSVLRIYAKLSWSHALNSFISSNISTFYKSSVSLISLLLPAQNSALKGKLICCVTLGLNSLILKLGG